jgi:hypothetical protein
MRTVDIPGGTAVLRERADLRTRDKRIIEAASVAALPAIRHLPQDKSLAELQEIDVADTDLSFDEYLLLMQMQDAGIVAALASWTLPMPLPTMATVGDLDPALTQALVEATRRTTAAIATSTDFDPSPDPESPTAPSSDSGKDLRAEPSSPDQGTAKSRSAGPSSGTGVYTRASRTKSSSKSPRK